MAWLALLRADLLALSRSWVVRGWIILLALVDFATLVPQLKAGQAVPAAASVVLSGNLRLFLFVWSTLIIVLSAGSFSHEADIVADGILSRACTRTQYIAAKLAARVLVILGIYATSSGIAGYCAWRYAASDMSALSAATGIAVVGLAILLLVTLGVTMSVILNNTLFATIGLLLLWYVAAPVFNFLGGEYLSPTSLAQNLPRMLKDTKAPEVLQCSATTSSLTVTFSKDVDAAQAENLEYYVVKCARKTRAARTAAYDDERTCVILSGLTLPRGKEVKVTVSGVTDEAGNEISPAANLATATVVAASGAAKVAEEEEPTPRTSRRHRRHRRSRSAERAADAVEPADRSDPPEDAAAITTTTTTTADETTPPEEAPAADEADRPAKPRSPKEQAAEKRPLRVASCTATATSLKVLFSRRVRAREAEQVRNYVVESPLGKTLKARSAAYDDETHTTLLSGLSLGEDDPVKVTVKNVKDADGGRMASGGNTATYSDVTTWKYFLGFGVPALLFALLGMVVFSRRDL